MTIVQIIYTNNKQEVWMVEKWQDFHDSLKAIPWKIKTINFEFNPIKK